MLFQSPGFLPAFVLEFKLEGQHHKADFMNTYASVSLVSEITEGVEHKALHKSILLLRARCDRKIAVQIKTEQ